MKHLLEIAQLIHRVKGRKSDVFEDGMGGLSSKNSKFNEFYESLLAGRYKNDRDAATHLYGCSPTDDRYRQLKSRFRKRLLNTLFAIDQYQTAATSAYERAVFQCNKDWGLVRILSTHDAPHTAADIARSVLSTALKFHLSEYVLNSARILREYTLHHGTEQDFDHYDALVREYSQVFDAEVRSESICHRVMLHHQLQTTTAKKEAFRAEIIEASNDLERLYEKFKSPDLYVNYIVIRACRCETERDWSGILAICREFDQFALQNPHFQHHKKIEKLWLKKFGAYLHLRDFSRGRLDAERLLQAIPEGDTFWFATLDRYFLLAMHTGQFAEARAIYERAANHPKFRKLPSSDREKWQIYDTYLGFFIQKEDVDNGVIKLNARNGKSSPEPFATAKDNRLLAVHHSVIQVVSAIAHDNYIGAAGQIDLLKSLATRQFKSEQPGRTQQFIRLLQHLAKSGFTNLSHNGTAQAFAELRRMPFHYSGVVQDLEVVPYERIWEEIVHNIQGN